MHRVANLNTLLPRDRSHQVSLPDINPLRYKVKVMAEQQTGEKGDAYHIANGNTLLPRDCCFQGSLQYIQFSQIY